MKYIIVSGSHRKESQSAKIADYLKGRVSALIPSSEISILSLAGNPLPLWDESIWEGDPDWKTRWAPYQSQLQATEALIFVVPEWGGMVPPGMKNLLLLCGPKDIGHKPALIVTVSASRNGAYPVSELRMSGYKNNYVCYLPEHIIIRDAEKVLNPTGEVSADETYLRKRIDHEIKVLDQYRIGLKSVRESGVLNFKDYANGM